MSKTSMVVRGALILPVLCAFGFAPSRKSDSCDASPDGYLRMEDREADKQDAEAEEKKKQQEEEEKKKREEEETAAAERLNEEEKKRQKESGLETLKVARDRHERSLSVALAYQAHPESEKILLFHKSHSRYGVSVSGALLFDREEEADVALIIVPQSARAQYALSSEGAWVHGPSLKRIYVPEASKWSEVFTGVKLAGELMRAMKVFEGEMSKESIGLQRRMEDVRISQFELRLLDQVTRGKYFSLIDAFLKTSQNLPDAPKTWYTKVDDSLFQQTQELFPLADADENTGRRTMLLHAMNARLAKKLKMKDEELASAF